MQQPRQERLASRVQLGFTGERHEAHGRRAAPLPLRHAGGPPSVPPVPPQPLSRTSLTQPPPPPCRPPPALAPAGHPRDVPQQRSPHRPLMPQRCLHAGLCRPLPWRTSLVPCITSTCTLLFSSYITLRNPDATNSMPPSRWRHAHGASCAECAAGRALAAITAFHAGRRKGLGVEGRSGTRSLGHLLQAALADVSAATRVRGLPP